MFSCRSQNSCARFSESLLIDTNGQTESMDLFGDQRMTECDGPIGLENLGNTCYLNAIIQVLSNTTPFRQYFLTNRFEEVLNESNETTRGMTTYTLATLLRQLWPNKNNVSTRSVRPMRMKSMVESTAPEGLSGGYGRQHDAHELCAFLLDSLHEDLNRSRIDGKQNDSLDKDLENETNVEKLANHSWNRFKRYNDSIIVDLFYGQYLSSIRCSVCPKVSYKLDPFAYLSLPIPNYSKNVKLEDCLKLYTAPEHLTQPNLWYCPDCRRPQEATKQINLWRLPNILIIQLKRFYFDNHMCAEKISSLVDFPVHRLDLSPFCYQTNNNLSRTYELYAVVNHYGGVNCGHYTTYVKYNSLDWLCFDDSRVNDIPVQSVVTRYAYMLFYRQSI